MKKSILLITIICSCFLVSCNLFEKKITSNQIESIKNKFSNKEITYFYETVFFVDPEARNERPFERNTKVSKWNKDIYIKAFGNLSKNNREALNETVEYLNTLNLPIKLYITNQDSYDIGIFYGSKQDIKKMTGNDLLDNYGNGMGICEVNDDDSFKKATIAIDTTDYSIQLYKNNALLEELTQTLGICGDSHTYPQSVFYQGSKNYKYSKKLAPIDVKVLQLLYSDNIKTGLTIDEFYDAFKNNLILHEELSPKDYKGFEHFIEHNKFSQKAIEIFCKTAFSKANSSVNEPHIQKWDRDIDYIFHKDIDQEDSLQISNTIKYLSQYVKKPKFSYRADENINANLTFGYFPKADRFEQDNLPDKGLSGDYQIINGRIFIFDKKITIKKDVTVKEREKLILRQLLIVLGLNTNKMYAEKPGTSILGRSDTLLSQYDKELIQLFFSETLKCGMTKDKIMEILKRHYPLDDFKSKETKEQRITNKEKTK